MLIDIYIRICNSFLCIGTPRPVYGSTCLPHIFGVFDKRHIFCSSDRIGQQLIVFVSMLNIFGIFGGTYLHIVHIVHTVRSAHTVHTGHTILCILYILYILYMLHIPHGLCILYILFCTVPCVNKQ